MVRKVGRMTNFLNYFLCLKIADKKKQKDVDVLTLEG